MHAAKVVGQIWDFAKQITTGDVVALPLKSHRAIALGKVEGGYEYRELAPTIKHTIPVKWLKIIPRDQFDQDLLYSLGSLMTVCQIERNDAEARIKHLIENVEDDKTAKGELMTILEDQKTRNNLNDSQLTDIIKEFKVWLISDPGQKLKKIVVEEKHEVRKIMKNLETLDKQSDDFTDWVLYGLLPHIKTQYAKRVSIYRAFRNIRKFFTVLYHYDEKDFNIIASRVYTLIKNVEGSPQQLDKWISEFVSEKTYSRGFQCGAISPLFSAVNDSLPVINSRVVNTYNHFANIFGWYDRMSPRLSSYLNGVGQCKKLIEVINEAELKDLANLDLFCYWYDYLFQSSKDEDSEADDDEIGYVINEKIKTTELDFPKFLESIEGLDILSTLQSPSLKNPDMVKINEVIRNCSIGKWVVPNFQRYFDWNKNNVKEFLESIFNDYYVGSLLFWEVVMNHNWTLFQLEA